MTERAERPGGGALRVRMLPLRSVASTWVSLAGTKGAAATGKPVAIINRGITRGDELATVKINSGCSEILALLTNELPAQNLSGCQ